MCDSLFCPEFRSVGTHLTRECIHLTKSKAMLCNRACVAQGESLDPKRPRKSSHARTTPTLTHPSPTIQIKTGDISALLRQHEFSGCQQSRVRVRHLAAGGSVPAEILQNKADSAAWILLACILRGTFSRSVMCSGRVPVGPGAVRAA